jgi:hypothetical protein
MSTSFSTITPGNFELSPCRVTYKGVDLGATDKVTVKIEEKLSPLKADQLGDTIIDNVVSGFKVTIETALDEVQLKANWKVVFPAHKLVTQNGNTMMYFDSQVGQHMAALGGPLILHPLSKTNSDKSTDFYVYLATAMPSSQLDFSSTEQQKLKVTFDVYPDFTTQPPRFCLYGDPSVGLVNASAGAATAGTGNVGADTVTGITVNNGATKTETITLLCVTAGASGLFNVNGSLSGPLGSATVGVSFSAFGNEIGFTVNDASPHAAVGDSYAIATTAANYT